ncbi:MAG: metallophosphoesterase [Gammaproteobacteria bacterium]|nr:metallophosphoesterase [Gammaproteobacteria bacterium]
MYCLRALMVLVSLLLVVPAHAEDVVFRFAGVKRVVVVGDAHGAYQHLVDLLRQTDLMDEKGQWTGGRTHLVSLGDLMDRGADSRKIMDLLMQLQQQAPVSGGRVHVLVGNHELMNLTGDLRDTTRSEFLSYQDLETPEQREDARTRYEALPAESRSTGFDEKYPPGFFGHRQAFSATGPYGAWLREQPYMIVINDMAFVHGGLPDMVVQHGLEGTNRELDNMLASYESGWQNLMATASAGPELDFDERMQLAENLPEGAGVAFVEASSVELFSPNGPLWTREDSLCIPVTVEDTLLAALEKLGVSKVLVGHTVTPDHRIETRMDGKVVMVDTGMLSSVYLGGRASALLVEDGRMQAYYLGEQGLFEVKEQARRIGPRPSDLTDDELEVFLATAEILSVEEVGEGVTRPRKVALEKDGIRLQAVFKDVNFKEKRRGRGSISIGDLWRYEVAAYRVDRLLGLGLIPVTVERQVDGVTGSLQYWVDGLISWKEKVEQGIIPGNWCPMQPQYELLKVFDGLIYNQDRTQQNLTFLQDNWTMILIDHSRSFEPDWKFPPAVQNDRYLVVRPAVARRLEKITLENVQAAVGDYLKPRQVKALVKRRDRLLKYHLALPEESSQEPGKR